MKIFLIHNRYRSKGGEDHNVEQIKELLEEKRHSITLYILDNLEITYFPFWRKVLPPLQSIFSLKSYRQVTNLIKNKRPGIAHVHNVFPLVSPANFLCKTKNSLLRSYMLTLLGSHIFITIFAAFNVVLEGPYYGI